MAKVTSEQSHKNASDFVEELEATGQESETKAVKWIQEVENKRIARNACDILTKEEELEKQRRGKKNPYFQSLYEMAKKELSEYDIPKGYMVDILLKEDGRIIFGLQKVGFRWYARGMKISGEPKYDINCVQRMVIQMMLSLDELYEQHELGRMKSGLHLPKKVTI
ncbi:MAG: hypothetical protein ACRDFB_03750 [Rhabdochlamydiaceae bacterium]